MYGKCITYRLRRPVAAGHIVGRQQDKQRYNLAACTELEPFVLDSLAVNFQIKILKKIEEKKEEKIKKKINVRVISRIC